MTPDHAILRSGRALIARHETSGAVPLAELRVWFAELEAVLKADPEREIEALGERTTLAYDENGYPKGLRR